MDVREKLVELILSTDLSLSYSRESDALNIADVLIANGVTVKEWIPVSEPPKEKGTYIVCTDKGGVLLGHWYGKEWNVGGGAKSTLHIG